MNNRIGRLSKVVAFCVCLFIGSVCIAKPKNALLPEDIQKFQADYKAQLLDLKNEIKKSLPIISEQKLSALQKAREMLKTAEAESNLAQKAQGKIHTAKALVDHARGKWIGGAEKGIAAARLALNKAITDAEKEAAKKDLEKWQANKEDGIKALAERQKALDQALLDETKILNANQTSKGILSRAQINEQNVADDILVDLQPILSSEKLDSKLVVGALLAKAIPSGLAEFASQNKEHSALVDQLLGDSQLMKQMLVAGGAAGGKYGEAMRIYKSILKTSPRASEGLFQRLALATGLQHAVPIRQTNALAMADATNFVDPVKRYLHYEKAWLDGELDPAFKDFSVWEYRMVVDCDAPDFILKWGREMLRNYRPDHIYNPDYGWRYSKMVTTEVKYGSECVKDDLPSLNLYQNIPKDGGVCGRRAFFGRFILKSFGIPTWGVTQDAHAAVGHWTPKGWVINLGAGFQWSWWDKGDSPRSGSCFLLETQARSNQQDYLKVLRAQWVSSIIGEQEYNDRKRVAGGLWSNMAHFQARNIATAAKVVALGPLGQNLGEANESEAKRSLELSKLNIATDDQKQSIGIDGVITIQSVSHSKPTGSHAAMRSYLGGLQLYASGGFKAQYVIDAPHSGKYSLVARVATVHEGQRFVLSANGSSSLMEVPVPYTVGMWQQSKPIELDLSKGRNTLQFAIKEGSRGVSIKDFTLTPTK